MPNLLKAWLGYFNNFVNEVVKKEVERGKLKLKKFTFRRILIPSWRLWPVSCIGKHIMIKTSVWGVIVTYLRNIILR